MPPSQFVTGSCEKLLSPTMKKTTMIKNLLSAVLILTLQTAASFGQSGEMIRRDVDIDEGISLHVVEQGEGEPLIFIHGEAEHRGVAG